MGKLEQAEQALTGAIARGVPETRARFLAPCVRRKLGDYDAKMDWQEGLSLEPSDSRSWLCGMAKVSDEPRWRSLILRRQAVSIQGP